MSRAFILLISFLISCNNSNDIPNGIIKPVQMQNILWDVIRGDILVQEIIKKDSTQNLKSANVSITEKILTLNNVDRLKFERSMAFYEKHPVLMKLIFDSLNAIQTRKKSLYMEEKYKNVKDHHFSIQKNK